MKEFSSCCTQTDLHGMTENALDLLSAVWGMLDGGEQVKGLSSLFSQYCVEQFHCTVPDDFLLYAAPAMSQLSLSHRTNVLYNLAKGIGSVRADKSDSLFPVKRMPMGLLEFMTNFFVSTDARNVSAFLLMWFVYMHLLLCCTKLSQIPSCPSDYRLWLQSMY